MSNQYPKDVKLEAAVLSAMLIDSKAHLEAMPLLKEPDMFYEPNNRLVFEAIAAVRRAAAAAAARAAR